MIQKLTKSNSITTTLVVPRARVRLLADYGGMLSTSLYLLRGGAAAAGLLGPTAGYRGGDWLFLVLSDGLIVAATRQCTTRPRRLALWLALFAATVLLADRYPVLEQAQIAISLGLMGVHLLNLRHCRRCLTQASSS